jgi:tetratricopeptide (TPR) repeat protein
MSPSPNLHRAAALAAAALALAAPRIARADDDPAALLRQARDHMSQLDYATALPLLERAEATGKNGPDGLAEIYRATAECHAALGETDLAETDFRRLLALSPASTLPDGSSPKLTAPFASAHDFMAARRPLEVTCQRSSSSSAAAASASAQPGGAVLLVGSDPADMVAGARLAGADGALVGTAAQGSGRIALAIPPGAAPTSCSALDSHGNELARVTLGEAPVVPPNAGEGGAGPGGGAVTVTRGAPAPKKPLYARLWLWSGVATVGAAGAAIYFGSQVKKDQDDLDALNGDSANHYFDEAKKIEDRGKRHALDANISWGVAGGLAALTGVLLVLDLRHHDDEEEGPPAAQARLAPTLSPSGAGVALSLGF